MTASFCSTFSGALVDINSCGNAVVPKLLRIKDEVLDDIICLLPLSKGANAALDDVGNDSATSIERNIVARFIVK